ncbi:hypothetical protein [Chlorogloea sp. CCALA 695]
MTSLHCPGVKTNCIGLPMPSAWIWILVLKPPFERPSASWA